MTAGRTLASSKDAHCEPRMGRPTIGYLTPRINNDVSQALWSGVVDAAAEQGANLICFVGEDLLDSAGCPSPANVAYELVSAELVHGLVSWASSLGGSLKDTAVASFHCRYQPLPIVSITLPMQACPTVSIDSYQGMQQIIAHLVDLHGYRRLAFIRGPEGRYYAQERYRAYADALRSYGLAVDPRLVTTPGDFELETGVAGIRQLLDERGLRPGIDFEAVVTVSDLPALGALRELQARGIPVPEVVALVGFNDTLEGRFVTPPLTSVRLPFYEQGRRAVEMLLALLSGGKIAAHVILPAKLKVRQSCGCLPPSVVQAAQAPVPVARSQETLATTLAARRDDVLQAMAQAAEAAPGDDPDWAARLFELFIAEAVGGSGASGTFLRELNRVLRRVMAGGGHVQGWQDVISTLRGLTLPCFDEADGPALRRAEDLWGQARVLIGEAAQRARGHQMVERATHDQLLREISRALVTTFDVTELAEVLVRHLPRLGIECCYLSLYDNPHDPTASSRLILGCDQSGQLDLNAPGFPSRQLAPIDLSTRRRPGEPYSLVLEPLYFQDEQIGFALFGIGPRDGTVYEVLRGQISSSLKGALLLNEIRTAQETAEKADALKTRLLANVSHELRSPLNVILGRTRDVLCSPTPYGVALPAKLLEDVSHIHHNAEHQLRLINDLLDLSRAEIGELDLYLEFLDPRPLLEDVFHGMAETRSRTGVTWTLRLPERLPTIQADPVRLRQIMLNLLSNADKFVEWGEVAVGAEVTPTHWHVWVQDTGPGIPAEMQERIFEPFVTGSRASGAWEGVGLGLSITRRLVALHRGCLTLDSRPGHGSTFHVYLPLPTLSDQPSAPSMASQPALLLISAHDCPAAELAELCQRQGLEIHRLRAGDDLDAVLQGVQPAALAWDLAGASPGDWTMVRRLRNHPLVSHVPFILYGQDADGPASLRMGMTNLVGKPRRTDDLMAVINGLCPPQPAGCILIVDDDPDVLDLYRQAVAAGCPGFPVRTAADGADAMACMAEKAPSLVILDLMMPKVDGFDVLDWMRSNEQTRQVPVLILSSRLLTLDDIKRLERHAMVTLHSKGVLSMAEMVASLHRALFGTDALPPQTGALVKMAVAYFHQNYDRPLARWEIAAAIGVSEDYLSRVFRRELGISPWDYLNRYRIMQAVERLRHTGDDVARVAHQVGFKDSAYFSRVFRKVTGSSPSAYREQAAAERDRRAR